MISQGEPTVKLGAQTYNLDSFPQKLHEIEKY